MQFLLFSAILFTAIFAEITENECVIRNRSNMSCEKYYNITHSVVFFSNYTAFVNFCLRYGVFFVFCSTRTCTISS